MPTKLPSRAINADQWAELRDMQDRFRKFDLDLTNKSWEVADAMLLLFQECRRLYNYATKERDKAYAEGYAAGYSDGYGVGLDHGAGSA